METGLVVYKIMLFLCIFLFTFQVLGASKNDDLVATLFRLCNYDEIEGLSFQEIQHCQVSTYQNQMSLTAEQMACYPV